MATTTTSTIHTGQLDLDMYDSASKQLVWRGVVSKTIDPNAKPDKRQKNMEKSVAKLLKNYPPPEKVAEPAYQLRTDWGPILSRTILDFPPVSAAPERGARLDASNVGFTTLAGTAG